MVAFKGGPGGPDGYKLCNDDYSIGKDIIFNKLSYEKSISIFAIKNTYI